MICNYKSNLLFDINDNRLKKLLQWKINLKINAYNKNLLKHIKKAAQIWNYQVKDGRPIFSMNATCDLNDSIEQILKKYKVLPTGCTILLQYKNDRVNIMLINNQIRNVRLATSFYDFKDQSIQKYKQTIDLENFSKNKLYLNADIIPTYKNKYITLHKKQDIDPYINVMGREFKIFITLLQHLNNVRLSNLNNIINIVCNDPINRIGVFLENETVNLQLSYEQSKIYKKLNFEYINNTKLNSKIINKISDVLPQNKIIEINAIPKFINVMENFIKTNLAFNVDITSKRVFAKKNDEKILLIINDSNKILDTPGKTLDNIKINASHEAVKEIGNKYIYAYLAENISFEEWLIAKQNIESITRRPKNRNKNIFETDAFIVDKNHQYKINDEHLASNSEKKFSYVLNININDNQFNLTKFFQKMYSGENYLKYTADNLYQGLLSSGNFVKIWDKIGNKYTLTFEEKANCICSYENLNFPFVELDYMFNFPDFISSIIDLKSTRNINNLILKFKIIGLQYIIKFPIYDKSTLQPNYFITYGKNIKGITWDLQLFGNVCLSPLYNIDCYTLIAEEVHREFQKKNFLNENRFATFEIGLKYEYRYGLHKIKFQTDTKRNIEDLFGNKATIKKITKTIFSDNQNYLEKNTISLPGLYTYHKNNAPANKIVRITNLDYHYTCMDVCTIKYKLSMIKSMHPLNDDKSYDDIEYVNYFGKEFVHSIDLDFNWASVGLAYAPLDNIYMPTVKFNYFTKLIPQIGTILDLMTGVFVNKGIYSIVHSLFGIGEQTTEDIIKRDIFGLNII